VRRAGLSASAELLVYFWADPTSLGLINC